MRHANHHLHAAVGTQRSQRIQQGLRRAELVAPMQQRDRRGLQQGVVRIAASQLLSSSLMPAVMAGFQAQHPQVKLQLMDVPVETVMARVFANEVDLGIGPERDPNSDIVASEWFAMPFMAVLPTDHALCHKQVLSWQDLAAYPFISLRGQFTQQLAQDLGPAWLGLAQRSVQEVQFMSTALAMVRAGMGLSICIPYTRDLVESHGLVLRPLVAPEVQRKFYIFTRRGKTPTPAAQAFLHYLQAQKLGVATGVN